MKTKLSFSLLAIFLLLCSFTSGTMMDVSWNDKELNFGQIKQGIPQEREFVVTNNSDEILILKTVRASCGCTTPKWATEPIMPGEKQSIWVGFNALHMGGFTKTITVETNFGTELLKIKGEVI